MAQRTIRPLLMPIIDIHHPHSLGKQACREAIDAVAHKLADRFGLGDMGWDGDTMRFSSRGMTGSLAVADSYAHLQMRVGPLLALMQPVIEAEIRRRLQEYLG
jgi:putative polyhydroxyalkanoate system protein